MNVASLMGTVLVMIASTSAYAGRVIGPNPVSEPGMLELLALGAVAATVIAIRKRRK